LLWPCVFSVSASCLFLSSYSIARGTNKKTNSKPSLLHTYVYQHSVHCFPSCSQERSFMRGSKIPVVFFFNPFCMLDQRRREAFFRSNPACVTHYSIVSPASATRFFLRGPPPLVTVLACRRCRFIRCVNLSGETMLCVTIRARQPRWPRPQHEIADPSPFLWLWWQHRTRQMPC
jgi:hypothetical protein